MPLIPLLLLALAIVMAANAIHPPAMVREDGVVQVTTRHHPYQ
jgi:hypothetical protein